MQTGPAFEACGIQEEDIENFSEYEDVLTSFNCTICLGIVKDPVVCPECEGLYCSGCWKMLKIGGKGCSLCKRSTDMVKANKFIYDVLNKLRIKCPNCEKGGIPYSTFLLHEELCIINNKYGDIEELKKILSEKKKELTEVKTNVANQRAPMLSRDEIRKRLVTSVLDTTQKMTLYKAAIQGRLFDFKDLVENKHFPILEEVSAHSYYWTPLHYAMHYGKEEIIFYILDTMEAKGELNYVMNLQSDDNRCPIKCLLKSNSVPNDVKIKIIQKIFDKYEFDISKELVQELKNRNLENLIKKK
ncbi:MAG: hypothetical protein MJ252_15540 [archaeon]|nr:hypothetical protein [archaeon]